MVDYAAKIKDFEDNLKRTQYHKGTEHHFGVVRAQIAKLREKIEKAGIKKGGVGFSVKRSGDATVIIIGFPSVGKSTLLNKLTGAKSKTAAYAFTTLTVIPGVLEYNGAKIQILDVPGIISGAAMGRGRGKEVLAMVRSADLILVTIDAHHPEHHQALLKELYDTNVRADKRPPDIRIKRKIRGGIDIGTTVKLSKVSKETLVAILQEFHINNADVVVRQDVDIDEFIDAVEENRKYIPSATVVTKVDLLTEHQKQDIMRELKPDLMVSAATGLNIDELRELIFNKLNFIRIFLKEVNKPADLEEPMILVRGITIRDVCVRIHRDFVKKFRFAKLWGKSAKFPGQVFRDLEKRLEDGDIIEVHVS